MTMEERCIINALLDRYESSKKFREGSSKQRIYLKFSSCKAITTQIHNSDDQRLFLEALENLQNRGLLSYTWVRYEKGNLVDTVYLSEEEERIRTCYREACRVPKKKMLEDLDQMIAAAQMGCRAAATSAAHAESQPAATSAAQTECRAAATSAAHAESQPAATSATQTECRAAATSAAQTECRAAATSAAQTESQPATLAELSDSCESMQLAGMPDRAHSLSRYIVNHSSHRANLGVTDFLHEMREQIRQKREIPRFFFRMERDSGDEAEHGQQDPQYNQVCQKNKRLLQFLTVIACNREEQLERVISARLYGDSKYFERELKSRVARILRHLADQESLGEGVSMTDDQLLESFGIFRWPEVLEFCGDLAVTLNEGIRIDYSGQIYGAYINSRTVQAIRAVEPGNITRILSIENKTNYTWYLSQRRQKGELVLYHGGVYSPMKGLWFSLIAEALPNVPAYHWSDIDLGGFRIFRRLKETIFPNLLPFQMDLTVLKNFESRAMPIESDGYREELEHLLQDPGYQEFHDVIRYMLEKDIRLEQEQQIEV